MYRVFYTALVDIDSEEEDDMFPIDDFLVNILVVGIRLLLVAIMLRVIQTIVH